MHSCICMSYMLVYINSQSSEKIQLDFNWILNFALCVPFKLDSQFCAIECKNQSDQIQLNSKLDFN